MTLFAAVFVTVLAFLDSTHVFGLENATLTRGDSNILCTLGKTNFCSSKAKGLVKIILTQNKDKTKTTSSIISDNKPFFSSPTIYASTVLVLEAPLKAPQSTSNSYLLPSAPITTTPPSSHVPRPPPPPPSSTTSTYPTPPSTTSTYPTPPSTPTSPPTSTPSKVPPPPTSSPTATTPPPSKSTASSQTFGKPISAKRNASVNEHSEDARGRRNGQRIQIVKRIKPVRRRRVLASNKLSKKVAKKNRTHRQRAKGSRTGRKNRQIRKSQAG